MANFRKKKKKDKIREKSDTPQIIRVRLPKGKEIIGRVEQRYGGLKMLVKCADGKERNCRVPGRFKRRLWLREGDFIIIEPWEFNDAKGDILYKYNPAAVEWLKNKGHLKTLSQEF